MVFAFFPWKKMFFGQFYYSDPRPLPPPPEWKASVTGFFSPSPDRFQFDFNWIVVCHMKVKVFDKMLFRKSSFFWILVSCSFTFDLETSFRRKRSMAPGAPWGSQHPQNGGVGSPVSPGAPGAPVAPGALNTPVFGMLEAPGLPIPSKWGYWEPWEPREPQNHELE